jgi:hypothetical protein
MNGRRRCGGTDAIQIFGSVTKHTPGILTAVVYAECHGIGVCNAFASIQARCGSQKVNPSSPRPCKRYSKDALLQAIVTQSADFDC